VDDPCIFFYFSASKDLYVELERLRVSGLVAGKAIYNLS
jgi:hypothetical protein